MYANEAEVGEGVRASGMRAEVMVTTKVAPTLAGAARTRTLGQGEPAQAAARHHRSAADPLAEPARAARRNARRHGQVKQRGLRAPIGVSNFTVALLEEAMKVSPEPIVCNQIEYHPFLDQAKVIAACKAHGMAVVAYSPIARGGAHGRQGAGAHRHGARQDRGAGLAALAGAAGHRRDPAHQQDRSGWRRISRCSTSNCRDAEMARDRTARATAAAASSIGLVAEVGLRRARDGDLKPAS